MPIRDLLAKQQAEEGAVFGPEELQEIAKAYEAILKDMSQLLEAGPYRPQ